MAIIGDIKTAVKWGFRFDNINFDEIKGIKPYYIGCSPTWRDVETSLYYKMHASLQKEAKHFYLRFELEMEDNDNIMTASDYKYIKYTINFSMRWINTRENQHVFRKSNPRSHYAMFDIGMSINPLAITISIQDLGQSIPLQQRCIEAIQIRDLPMLESLVEENENLPKMIDDLLKIAIEMNNNDALSFLLESGAQTEIMMDMNMTPLLWASRHRDIARTQLLLKAGANTEAKMTTNNFTPLHYAARESLKLTKLLVDAGSSIDSKSKKLWTPLMGASFTGNLDIAKYLVESGANYKYQVKANGWSAMFAAIQNNHHDLIEYFYSLDPDSKYGYNNLTLLDIAVRYGHIETCKYIIEKQLAIDFESSMKTLMLAIINGSAEKLDLLVNTGFSIHHQIENNNSQSLLHFAIFATKSYNNQLLRNS